MIHRYLIIFLLYTSQLLATEYFVSSATEISAAMGSAQPGDTLTMTNGTWTDQRIVFRGNGVDGDSILLRAETPGKVVLTGTSNLRIYAGSHWLF